MKYLVRQTKKDGTKETITLQFASKEDAKNWVKEMNIPGDVHYRLIKPVK